MTKQYTPIEIGSLIHNRPEGRTVKEVAAELGVTPGVAYAAQKAYRAARSYGGDSGDGALVLSDRADLEAENERLRQKLLRLEAERESLQAECNTLQKIVIALGERL